MTDGAGTPPVYARDRKGAEESNPAPPPSVRPAGNLEQAIGAVRSGRSLSDSARSFGVPRSTLRRHVRSLAGQPATARPTVGSERPTAPADEPSRAEPEIPDGARVDSLVAPLALRLSALESWATGQSAARDREPDVDGLVDAQELTERELTRLTAAVDGLAEQLAKLRGDLAELADATHSTGDLLVRLVAFVRWRVHAAGEQHRASSPEAP